MIKTTANWKKIVIDYFGSKEDNKRIQNEINKERLDQLDLQLSIVSLFIGVGELRGALLAKDINIGARALKVGLASANVVNSADDILKGSENLKEGALKTIINNLKLALNAYNIAEGVSAIAKTKEKIINKTKAVYSLTLDSKDAKEKIEGDIKLFEKKLNELKKEKSN